MRYASFYPLLSVGGRKFNDNYAIFSPNDGQAGDSVNKRIDDQNLADLDFTGDFTIEVRIRLMSAPGAGATFPYVFKYGAANNDDGFAAIRISASDITFWWLFATPSTSVNRRILNGGAFSLDTWYHIVIAFEKGVQASIYVNNTKTSTNTDVSIFQNGGLSRAQILGGVDNNSYQMHGYHRGVRVYSGYAADDTDVNNLYNTEAKNWQDIPAGMQQYLVREDVLNQTFGRDSISDEGLGRKLELKNWSDADIKTGGGTWVDVSAI